MQHVTICNKSKEVNLNSLNKALNRDEEIQALRAKNQELEEQLKLADLIFDHIENGAIVTDADDIIIKFNKPYAEFLGGDPKEYIGRKVTDVIENTRMNIVSKTLKPEKMLIQRIKGKDLVVQRIPIIKNKKVKAVFGQIMFRDVKEIRSLAKTLETMESQVQLYEKELLALRRARYTLDNIIGKSEDMVCLRGETLQNATHNLSVLISGESGTGKEVFAQAIHNASIRNHHPFVRVNCSSIPRDLFESEFFGYVKGAFTGAQSQGKPGKFELAGAGTIFLDEIGELPLHMQPKLLSVLEEKEFERVGGTQTIKAQCRIIAATNRNLETMIAQGKFRNDLFYRLSVVPMKISPLRNRRDDILPIANFLINQIAEEENQYTKYFFSENAAEILTHYKWPGNVRELNNVLARVFSSIHGNQIKTGDLPPHLYRNKSVPRSEFDFDLKDIIAKTEKEIIIRALNLKKNNKAQAAQLMGIDRTILYRKIKKYGIPI